MSVVTSVWFRGVNDGSDKEGVVTCLSFRRPWNLEVTLKRSGLESCGERDSGSIFVAEGGEFLFVLGGIGRSFNGNSCELVSQRQERL